MALYEDNHSAEEIAAAIDTGEALVSAINLGEVLYSLERTHGREQATELVDQISSVITVEEPDWDLIAQAAHIKAGGGLSYADAFCVSTAQRHKALLYTGDPEILALKDIVELLDLRATAG
jgi:predicted nucleic acid-binding protein